MSAVRRVARQAIAWGIGLVRVGPREVLWTPPNIGVGNLMYLWLWARGRREQGIDAWVRQTHTMLEWTLGSQSSQC